MGNFPAFVFPALPQPC